MNFFENVQHLDPQADLLQWGSLNFCQQKEKKYLENQTMFCIYLSHFALRYKHLNSITYSNLLHK